MDWKISGRQIDGVDRIAAKFTAHAKAYPACKKGNFAVMFGLALIPILAAVGVSVDYVRAYKVQTFMQDEVDTTALGSAHLGQTGNYDPLIQLASATINQRFGNGAWIEGLDVQGNWVSATDFQVNAHGTVPVTILAAVPGMPSGVPVSASATVRVAEPTTSPPPPTITELDPDADDYNRIYIYCFDKERVDEADKGRSQERLIADNDGNKYSYEMPKCKSYETLSFRLENFLNGRKDTSRRESEKANNYYTDTIINNQVASYSIEKIRILKTILCNNEAECRPRREGGIIPEGANQKATIATGRCTPGKFTYYGWEDRPPKPGDPGSSDQDYNDIRIVMACPVEEQVGDRTVRLIR